MNILTKCNNQLVLQNVDAFEASKPFSACAKTETDNVG